MDRYFTMNERRFSIDREILGHYGENYEERGRLTRRAAGILEFARSRELILRHLPPPPNVVSDIGGGPGVYACWLAREGYEVHLVDPVPLHLQQAAEASSDQPATPIASVSLGDARSLAQGSDSCDSLLLMGPMYHLTNRADRLTALREAHRVLRPSGLIFVSAVNRFASLFDGLTKGLIDDPYFYEILQQGLKDGQHRNPRGSPEFFTTAFFHTPEELEDEISQAGFTIVETTAIQGPGWMVKDFEVRWSDAPRRRRLMDLLRTIEHERAAMWTSPHMMAIAKR